MERGWILKVDWKMKTPQSSFYPLYNLDIKKKTAVLSKALKYTYTQYPGALNNDCNQMWLKDYYIAHVAELFLNKIW